MRLHLLTSVVPILICFAVVAVQPARAGQIYDNGPVNGNIDAWTINFGYAVSDSFTISGGNTTLTGMSFWARMFPGDLVTSVEISLTSAPFTGTTYFDQIVAVTQANCFFNAFGYQVCQETGGFAGPTLGNGTYYVNLQNATIPDGDPVYWEENSGVGCQSPGCPSTAYENTIGTIPSEAFSLFGNVNGSTPEPNTALLLGSGVVGLAGMLRRKPKA